MKMGNFAFECAEARAECERETAIAKAKQALQQPGARYCMDCGDEIDPRRRAVLPSARRCRNCQQAHEGTGA